MLRVRAELVGRCRKHCLSFPPRPRPLCSFPAASRTTGLFQLPLAARGLLGQSRAGEGLWYKHLLYRCNLSLARGRAAWQCLPGQGGLKLLQQGEEPHTTQAEPCAVTMRTCISCSSQKWEPNFVNKHSKVSYTEQKLVFFFCEELYLFVLGREGFLHF